MTCGSVAKKVRLAKVTHPKKYCQAKNCCLWRRESDELLLGKMILELKIPDSIHLDSRTTLEFRAFLQAIVNRRCVGVMRYGDRPKSRQKYMTRLSKELRAYRREGNAEQLMNIAVYAFLESAAPENKKLHWDATVDSVTRAEMGI